MVEEVAAGVWRLPSRLANHYLVGEQRGGGPWMVVDAGLPASSEAIVAAAESLYGPDSRPVGIVLTHAHIDHYGSAQALAQHWGVPIWAHRLDLPYLTGRDRLPPSDPAVGGLFARVSWLLPASGTDLGERVHALPDDGAVPGMPDWRWIATPGNTPGHVSLWRESDRTLLAGDALTTMNVDDIAGLVKKRRPRIGKPVPAEVSDWPAARRSLEALAALRPYTVAAGHGAPMSGPGVADELAAYARDFRAPLHGRYIADPARFDENGVVFLPPPAPPVNAAPKLAALAVGGALAVYAASRIAARYEREDDGDA